MLIAVVHFPEGDGHGATHTKLPLVGVAPASSIIHKVKGQHGARVEGAGRAQAN